MSPITAHSSLRATLMMTGLVFALDPVEKGLNSGLPSHSFRPGSGAEVLSAHAAPLRILTSTEGTDTGSSLLTAHTVSTIAATTLALIMVAAVGMMAYRHHSSGNPQYAGMRQPLGSAHIPAHHLGKVPPGWDPRYEHQYSFRQYMKDM